jgi:transketolase
MFLTAQFRLANIAQSIVQLSNERKEIVVGDWVNELRSTAMRVRRHAFEVCARHNGGYLIQACGSADILTALYFRLMDLGESSGPLQPEKFEGVPKSNLDAQWGGVYNGSHDRFFLSPAHYALALYATLIEAGRLAPDALDGANDDGSTMEMIGAEHSPGFESTSGSLAQALSVAVGTALARKRQGKSGHVWALISDGELEEGQTWEALSVASNFKLDNLTVMLDANGLQVDGWVRDVTTVEPIVDKVRAFGFKVVEVDGHNPAAIVEAGASGEPNRPLFVVCRTKPTFGIEAMEGRHQLHYIRFRPGEIEAARTSLDLADLKVSA